MKSTLPGPGSMRTFPSTDIAEEKGQEHPPSFLECATGVDAECDDDEEELCPSLGEKKRRLGEEQVRALEQTFEADSKLDPERKSRLARDLGLQPRQVAVWFQNRRARSKTKQLERDFAALKARHDALRLQCDALRRDKDTIATEIGELQVKLEISHRMIVKQEGAAEEHPVTAVMFKDGPSDSDSSAVFNDEASLCPGMAMGHQCFLGFTASCPSPSSLLLEANGHHEAHHRSLLEEEVEGIFGKDGRFGGSFFAEAKVSNLSSWYYAEEWE